MDERVGLVAVPGCGRLDPSRHTPISGGTVTTLPPMRRRTDQSLLDQRARATRDIVRQLLEQREWVLKLADGIESGNLMPGETFTRVEVARAIREAVGEV